MMAGAWLAMVVAAQAPERGALPEMPLLGRQTDPYVAPGGVFSVRVPSGWGVVPHDEDPSTVEFRAVGRPGDAFLIVRRISVPRGAHPRQLLLVALEQRLRRLPNFNLISKRDVVLAGRRAASIVATYAFQGNLQFPRALEEVFLVVGTEAFVFHFECFQPAAAQLAADVSTFYETFAPRTPSAADAPDAHAPSSAGLFDGDAVPF